MSGLVTIGRAIPRAAGDSSVTAGSDEITPAKINTDTGLGRGRHRHARRPAAADRHRPAPQGQRLGAAERQAQAPGKAMTAARREAMEETGQNVSVHEYLGAISYKANGKPKIVQFWRMRSAGGAAREPMGDIKAVEWLTLDAAIARLTQPLERIFLAQIGRRTRKRRHPARRRMPRRRTSRVRRKTARNIRVSQSAARIQEYDERRRRLRPNLLRRILRRLRQHPGKSTAAKRARDLRQNLMRSMTCSAHSERAIHRIFTRQKRSCDPTRPCRDSVNRISDKYDP